MEYKFERACVNSIPSSIHLQGNPEKTFATFAKLHLLPFIYLACTFSITKGPAKQTGELILWLPWAGLLFVLVAMQQEQYLPLVGEEGGMSL